MTTAIDSFMPFACIDVYKNVELLLCGIAICLTAGKRHDEMKN